MKVEGGREIRKEEGNGVGKLGNRESASKRREKER